jgi:hypothetical protein
VVQKLQRRGLVARGQSKDDARRVELSLTPAARSLLRKAPRAAQDRIIDAVAAMPGARRKQLADLLADLAHRLGGREKPAMLFEDDPGASSPPAAAPKTRKTKRRRPPRGAAASLTSDR